jgi:D-serine dehydratase
MTDAVSKAELSSDRLIDSRTKGLPPGATGLPLSAVGAQRWNLLREDLPLPVAVLREDALADNSRWMQDFVARTGAKLAPHGKTTMSPQLFERQIADGAWGVTLATVHQAQVARKAGVSRILLANEPVGRLEIGWLLAELRADPEFELLCLVDSVEGVRRLATAAAAMPAGRPIEVLLEIGDIGGRCGCRDLASALDVAKAIADAAPHIALRGVEGFEGLHQHTPGAEGAARASALLERIVAVAERLDRDGAFDGRVAILSAGGSAFYDLVTDIFASAQLSQPPEVILRSGCYLTHDSGLYARSFAQVRERSSVARAIEGGFSNALEVWAYVLSVPEPGRAILGAGRRDFGDDAARPVPLNLFRPSRDEIPEPPPPGRIVAVNDQHAHLELGENADVQVGDMIALGVSHPCTTFDKWRLILVVDPDYAVVSAVETYF